jgi:hypothetical protein
MLQSTRIFEGALGPKWKSLPSQSKCDLLRVFWPNTQFSPRKLDEASYDDFLDFVANELEQVRHHQVLFAAQDFDETSAIIQALRRSHHRTCSEIIHSLSPQFPDSEVVKMRRSLELSTRLWLTLNTHSSDIAVGPIFANDVSLEWNEDTSLDTLLQAHFVKSGRTQSSSEYAKIDPAFTAAYLINTCGMRLQWTDNIAAHLNFDLKRVALTVYRHKICLVNHLDNLQSCPIPKDILNEMLDTMNLLFPFGDVATKQLLLKEGQKSMYSLGSCGRSRVLDAAHYQYFGEELEHLIGYFDKTPRTWKQLAFDRRNKLEWSAFWVTVMVGILTLVSIPCNIIQATYSVKAYQATIAQANTAQQRQL